MEQKSQPCWFSTLLNVLWPSSTKTNTTQWVEEKFSLLFLLLHWSICWKKMSQTSLKVIGLDHHYTFYSMSWGCLRYFCWKIHLFEKIHYIQCSRTKQQSSEPATPPASAFLFLLKRDSSPGYRAKSNWNKWKLQTYNWKK